MNFISFLPSDIEDFSIPHECALIGTETSFCALKSRNQQNHSYSFLCDTLVFPFTNIYSYCTYMDTEVPNLIGMKLVTDRQADTQTDSLTR